MPPSLNASLPIPPHFDSRRVASVWRVPYQERAREAEAWAKTHGIVPASADRTRLCLMPIDVQNSFCLPEFELFVAGRSGMGAVEDNVRLCEFVYRNLGRLTAIVPTMDTHTAMQIFHSVFLVDERGEHPAPMTPIALEDVERGRWRVNPAVADSLAAGDRAALQGHLLHYCRALAARGKYQLMVWPYHAMLGGIGQCLVSAVEEALFFHAVARASQTRFEVKGANPLTENYSVLRPEVLDTVGGAPIAEKNARFVSTLLAFDAVIIAGQAKSHCVTWTIDDLLTEILAVDERLVRKVYILEDCTSPVVIPGLMDFTEQADAAFRRFAEAGVHLMKSTDPLEQWPGLRV